MPYAANRRGMGPRRAGFSARYYTALPPAPTTRSRADAADYHLRIVELFEADGGLDLIVGGDPHWTRAERGNLQRLERRWRARAAGEDLRWNLVGARAGRLPASIEDQLQPPGDPAWHED